MIKSVSTSFESFYDRVREIIETARGAVYRDVNLTMVKTYWQIGRVILEEDLLNLIMLCPCINKYFQQFLFKAYAIAYTYMYQVYSALRHFEKVSANGQCVRFNTKNKF